MLAGMRLIHHLLVHAERPVPAFRLKLRVRSDWPAAITAQHLTADPWCGTLRPGLDRYGNGFWHGRPASPGRRLALWVQHRVEKPVVHAVPTTQASWMLAATPLTQAGPQLIDLADRAGPRPHRDRARLADLLHARLSYAASEPGTDTSAEHALARGTGVCRDFTHVALACLRRSGCAALYVGGYLLRDGRAEPHCWLLLRSATGWIGWDPTLDCAPGADHVPLNWGRDQADLLPCRIAHRGTAGLRVHSVVSLSA